MSQPPPLPPPHSTLLVGITSGRCAGCAATSSAALQAKRDGSARHSAALGAQLRQPAPPWWHSGSHQAATIGRMTCFKLGGGKPRKCNLKKRISHTDKNLLTHRVVGTFKQRSLCSLHFEWARVAQQKKLVEAAQQGDEIIPSALFKAQPMALTLQILYQATYLLSMDKDQAPSESTEAPAIDCGTAKSSAQDSDHELQPIKNYLGGSTI